MLDLFPVDFFLGRGVVAQHAERFHRFGMVVHELVHAVLETLSCKAQNLVEPFAAQEFRKLASVRLDFRGSAEKDREFAEYFGFFLHERGKFLDERFDRFGGHDEKNIYLQKGL